MSALNGNAPSGDRGVSQSNNQTIPQSRRFDSKKVTEKRHVCRQLDDVIAGLDLPIYGRSLADQCVDHSKPERCICLDLAVGSARDAIGKIARRYRIDPDELAKQVVPA